MSLHAATLEQLIEWQTQIVHEIARRAGPQAPIAATPPWEMGPPARTWTPPAPAPPPMSERDQLMARIAALDGGHMQTLAPPQGAPSMLGGQQPFRPVVLTTTTQRTDPAAAAVFVQTKPRSEGVPGPRGDGRGMGGQIGFSGE